MHPFGFQDGLDLYRNGFHREGESVLLAAARCFGLDYDGSENCPWVILAEGSWNRSREAFERLQARQPGWWEPPLRLAEACMQTDRFAEAADLIDTAKKTGAPDGLILRHRLMLALLSDRYDTAEAILRDRRNDPEVRLTDYAGERIRHHHDVTRFSRAGVILRVGFWAGKILADGRSRRYLEVYIDRVVHHFPNVVVALKLKRWYHENTRDFRQMDLGQERRSSYRIIKLRSRNADSYLHLARSYSETRNFIRMEELCRDGIRCKIRDPRLKLLLGNALAGQRRFDEALRVYHETGWRHGTASVNAAAAAILLSDPDSAREILDCHKPAGPVRPLELAIRLILDPGKEPAARRFEAAYPWDEGEWLHGRAANFKDRVSRFILDRDARAQFTDWRRIKDNWIPCPVCGVAEKANFRMVYRHPLTGVRINTCAGCGFITANPMPGQNRLARFYRPEYFGFDIERTEWFTALRDRIPVPMNYYRSRFEWLERYGLPEFERAAGDSRRMLDVGCGTGLMLNEMKRRGWGCAGMEIEPAITRYLAGKGFEVYSGTSGSVSLDPGTFHFVNLAHVIEHVPDPLELLRFTRRVLKPEGWLFLITPCCRTVPAVFAGREWLNDPMHVHFFDRKSIVTLVTASGFRIRALRMPVGVRFETNGSYWRRMMVSPAVEELLTDHDLGDVIWVLAEAI
ncbi:methyltransferase domain-containing protein [bacterium]|nr:methyltransferase domain-containing protein [candidate division CSSED10-310 bacterium]